MSPTSSLTQAFCRRLQYVSGDQDHWDEEVLSSVAGWVSASMIRTPVSASQLFQNIYKSAMDLNHASAIIHPPTLRILAHQIVSGALISTFTAGYLSAYLSPVSSPSDTVLSFRPADFMLSSASVYLSTPVQCLSKVQDQGEKRKYIVMLMSRNADVSRVLAVTCGKKTRVRLIGSSLSCLQVIQLGVCT
jgi:hypothetical protein